MDSVMMKVFEKKVSDERRSRFNSERLLPKELLR